MAAEGAAVGEGLDGGSALSTWEGGGGGDGACVVGWVDFVCLVEEQTDCPDHLPERHVGGVPLLGLVSEALRQAGSSSLLSLMAACIPDHAEDVRGEQQQQQHSTVRGLALLL